MITIEVDGQPRNVHSRAEIQTIINELTNRTRLTFVPEDEQPPNLKRWTYTVQEVAKRCGRQDRTVRNWIEAGRLRSVKKTGRHLILVDSLNEFFSAN